MLQIAYCDDERTSLEIYPDQIRLMFESRGYSVAIELYEEIAPLIERIIDGKHYDVLFLDIDMRGLDGIEGGKQLRTTAKDTMIIYVSSHEHLVFDTFQIRPFRFFRKEHFFTDLEQAAPAIVDELLHQKDTVKIMVGNRVHILNPYDIVYVESHEKTLEIHTKKEKIQMRYKMIDLHKLLDPYGFIRIHKGFLVNFRSIKYIGTEFISLKNGLDLPMSRLRKKDVLDQLERLL